MHTSKLTKWQTLLIAIILSAIIIEWTLLMTAQPDWLVRALLLAQLTLLAFSTIGYHLERAERRRQVKLLESAFVGLEPALVVLFEALTGRQHSRYGEYGLQAYLRWKTEYIQEFGAFTIVDHACRGVLPIPGSDRATLVLPVLQQETIRHYALAATTAVQ